MRLVTACSVGGGCSRSRPAAAFHASVRMPTMPCRLKIAGFGWLACAATHVYNAQASSPWGIQASPWHGPHGGSPLPRLLQPTKPFNAGSLLRQRPSHPRHPWPTHPLLSRTTSCNVTYPPPPLWARPSWEVNFFKTTLELHQGLWLARCTTLGLAQRRLHELPASQRGVRVGLPPAPIHPRRTLALLRRVLPADAATILAVPVSRAVPVEGLRGQAGLSGASRQPSRHSLAAMRV